MVLLTANFAYAEARGRRALFVSLVQDPPVFTSDQAMRDLVQFAKKSHSDTLFVQVYRSNIAWFASKVSDTTEYEASRKNLRHDPLRFLIREAHASGIEVHAWLNLLSLSANTEAPILKRYGLDVLTCDVKPKKNVEDYKIDNQYFLEPGDGRVRRVLATAVEELVRAYPELDGIQFDYIRYPDVHPVYGYAPMNVDRFKKASGLQRFNNDSPRWQQWKRSQVTDLLKELIQKARAIHPGIQVSTTGLMPFTRAYYEGFQDWKSWLSDNLVDFVTLMCYYDSTKDFELAITSVKKIVPDLTRVNLAAGPYKFLHSPEIFDEQFPIAERAGFRDVALLHYGSFLENPRLGRLVTGDRKQ